MTALAEMFVPVPVLEPPELSKATVGTLTTFANHTSQEFTAPDHVTVAVPVVFDVVTLSAE